MRDCWDHSNIRKDYPLIAEAYLVAVGPPHSDVGNERNFSQLGLILTPLRKAQLGVTTMEQSVLLTLTAREGRWTPLPDRASDPFYQQALCDCHLDMPDVLLEEEKAVADTPDAAADYDKMYTSSFSEPEVVVDDEAPSEAGEGTLDEEET